MRTITLLLFALTALMAVLGFSAAPDGSGDLARILFAAFGALCLISVALSIATTLDENPHK